MAPRKKRKVPRAVCWNIGDQPVAGRFVTHVRVPLSAWRWKLPAPMPAHWVARLTFTAFGLAVGALVAVSLTTRFVPLGVVAAAAAVWIVGRLAAALAGARLRREAWSVLAILDEAGKPAGPWWEAAELDDEEIWSQLDGPAPE